MATNLKERRSEPRGIIDRYYSVEFSLRDCSFVYQFKIWNISTKGICVKVADVVNLRYYPADSSQPGELLETEIKHITKDEQGRFKGVYLVGLAILDDQDSTQRVLE
jgi:hypothetical protein